MLKQNVALIKACQKSPLNSTIMQVSQLHDKLWPKYSNCSTSFSCFIFKITRFPSFYLQIPRHFTLCTSYTYYTRVSIFYIADIVSLSRLSIFLPSSLFIISDLELPTFRAKRYLKQNLFWYRKILPTGLLLPSYYSLATWEVNSSLDKKLSLLEKRRSLEDWSGWVKSTNSHPRPVQEPF